MCITRKQLPKIKIYLNQMSFSVFKLFSVRHQIHRLIDLNLYIYLFIYYIFIIIVFQQSRYPF